MNRRQFLTSIPVFVTAIPVVGCLGDETDLSEYSDEELLPPKSELDTAMPDWDAERIEDDLTGVRYRIDPSSGDGNSIFLDCESHEGEDMAQEDYQNSDHYGDETEQLDVGDGGYYKVHWDGAGGGVAIEFYEGSARGSVHRVYPSEEFNRIEEGVPEYYHDLLDVTQNHWESLAE